MRFLLVLLVLVLLAAGGAWLFVLPKAPPGEIFVDLAPGTSTSAMAAALEANGVIRSRYAFLLIRAFHRQTSLKAGEYRFADPAKPLAVYNRIARGDIYTRQVTIPEGYNLYDIAAALETAGFGPRAIFFEAAHTNVDLIATYTHHATSLEGYLFPDTYRFSRKATPRLIFETMVRRFRIEGERLHLAGDWNHTVILASLVEKEVRYDDERGRAAAVFINRLHSEMPLQTDPTVIYAALLENRWTGSIHRADLDAESPYNTYRQRGLPPGPICSPGSAALRAAAHPPLTQDLYFMAGPGGHTRFSQTLAEHDNQLHDYYNNR